MDQLSLQVTNLHLERQKSFAAAIAALRRNARGDPRIGAKVKNTPFVATFPKILAANLLPLPSSFNNPQVLVPANKNRIGLVLAGVFQQPVFAPALQFEAFYSFGYPAATSPIIVAGGPPPIGQAWGLPLPGVTFLDLFNVAVSEGPLGNGTISTDAIWVTLSPAIAYIAAGLDIMPGFIIAYEQSLALEADNMGRAA